MSNEVVKWGDSQQYYSEPMPEQAKKEPVVTLINAMPDPLGSLAVICGIYKGKVYRDRGEVTDEDRLDAFHDMMKTELNGALEVGLFHFLIEGVGRDFTHQAVRDRTSFFGQESLRFAVKKGWTEEVELPPSLQGLKDGGPQVIIWRNALSAARDAYDALVEGGVPAEDARKLLPHAATTRYHWVVNLRTLLREAGKRTCTQAQFEWRIVFSKIAKALREYRPIGTLGTTGLPIPHGDAWQFQLIADQLRPHCFQAGSCGFMAKFDRDCRIRERVEIRTKNGGIDPSQWHKPFLYYKDTRQGPVLASSDGIEDWEWATDPGAARK